MQFFFGNHLLFPTETSSYSVEDITTKTLLLVSIYCFSWKEWDELIEAVVLNAPEIVYHWPWGGDSQWPVPGTEAKIGVIHMGTLFMESPFSTMKRSRLPQLCTYGSPPLTSLQGVNGG